MSDYKVQRLLGGFAIKWTDSAGKPHRYRLKAADQASADAEARAWWAAETVQQWTVGSIVDAYRADRVAEGIATVQRQADAWKAMRGFWQDVLPETIDDQMCRDYDQHRGVGPATVAYELRMLSVALRWAAKAPRRYIAEVPEIWRPAAPDPVERHLTKDQFVRFLDGTVAPHARLYASLAVCTAARPTAILQIRWTQVNFERRQINLNQIGRVQTIKRRPIVPINDKALEVLEEAFPARRSEFVVDWAGGNIKNIKKAFQAASRRSGVKATPYSLRHTAAVWMAEEGVSMDEIAQYLGDDTATVVKHYARFSPSFLRRAASALTW